MKPSDLIPALANFKVTLSRDSNGDGKPDEVLNLMGFEAPGIFDVVDNRVRFRTYVGGPTTPGTTYARTETRETNPMKWNIFRQTHTLRGTLCIRHLPPNKPEVVVGQVHDAKDDLVMVLAKQVGDKINIYASWSNGKGKGSNPVHIGTVEFGQYFTYEINIHRRKVRVMFNGAIRSKKKMTRTQCYYKFGCYIQSNAQYDSIKEYAEVLFSGAWVSHS